MNKWHEVAFESLASKDRWAFTIGPFGSKVTTQDYRTVGIPFIRGVNLASGIFLDDEFVYIDEDKASEVESAIVVGGDLVFTRKGTVGQVSMVPYASKFDRYVISGSQMKARLDTGRSCPQFYYYWFKSPVGQSRLLANASAVGVPSIPNSLATLREIKVPIPPLPEQQKIAALLGVLDDKIAVNDRTIYVCIEMASSLLQHEVNTAETKDVSLKEAASSLSGGTPKTSEPTYWSGDLPWISAASLKSFLIGNSERRLTAIGATSGTKVVPPGTTICVVRGMSLKTEFRMGITMRKVAFGQDCKAFVPRGDITPHVLAYSLWNKRANVLKLVDEAGHGTGRLDSELLGSIQLTVPSKERMGQLEQRLEKLTYLGEMRREESEKLGRLRDTLLPKLMSGQVRIRDAEKVVEDAV